jgi:hypothetical protein
MYAHSKEELRSTGAYHKTKLCRFMQTGHCTLGSKCNFAHSAVELREPETIDALGAPPGLGWESMLDGLLSDEEGSSEDDAISSLKPAYVNVPALADAWTLGATGISEADCKNGSAAFKESHFPMTEDTGLASFWDYQCPGGAMDFPLGDMSCYSPEGSNFAYGGAFNDWTGAWAGNAMADLYTAAPLYGSGFGIWDWRQFGDSVVIDQKKDTMKVKRAKPDKATPKMRSVRTSESTLCTLGDTTVQM